MVNATALTKKMMSSQELGMKIQNNIKNLKNRTEEHNIQKMFGTFKNDLVHSARTIAKQTTPGINEEIKNLKQDIKVALNTNKMEEKDILT